MEELSDAWLRALVARHPYAMARQGYLASYRELQRHPRARMTEATCILVVLEDCVIIFEDKERRRFGLRSFAGTLWWQHSQLKIVELLPDDDRFPSQQDMLTD